MPRVRPFKKEEKEKGKEKFPKIAQLVPGELGLKVGLPSDLDYLEFLFSFSSFFPSFLAVSFPSTLISSILCVRGTQARH